MTMPHALATVAGSGILGRYSTRSVVGSRAAPTVYADKAFYADEQSRLFGQGNWRYTTPSGCKGISGCRSETGF